MITESSQKMTYQERESLKTFTDRCALQGDTQSLQMTLRMLTHWMRQASQIEFTEYATHWTAAQAQRDDGNHSTGAMAYQWPLRSELKIKLGYSEYKGE